MPLLSIYQQRLSLLLDNIAAYWFRSQSQVTCTCDEALSMCEHVCIRQHLAGLSLLATSMQPVGSQLLTVDLALSPCKYNQLCPRCIALHANVLHGDACERHTLAVLVVVTAQVSDMLEDEVCGCVACSSARHSSAGMKDGRGSFAGHCYESGAQSHMPACPGAYFSPHYIHVWQCCTCGQTAALMGDEMCRCCSCC